MRNCGRVSPLRRCRCDRMVMLLFLVSTAAALVTFLATEDSSVAFVPTIMVDALFLMTSSHHQRRPPQSRAPRSGPSMAASPKPESNTKRRRRESRLLSPLIVFYGMVLERPGCDADSTLDNREDGEEIELNGNAPEGITIQRKQEFRQQYENFRGKGRWGGYSLVAMQQETQTGRAPLPVVSTTTKAAATTTSVTKPMKQRRPNTRFRRAIQMQQITNIQQYKEEVVDSTDSSLVVVRFYAPWCKACKAIESSYHRLSLDFPSSVKFVEVPLTKENAYLHKGLGIPSLPFAHVYYNDDHIQNNGNGKTSSCRLVDELKINKRKFSDFKRIIRSYVDKECDVHYSSGTTNGENNNDETVVVTSVPRLRQTVDVAENEAIPGQ